MIFLLIAAILIVIVIVFVFRQKRITKNTIKCFTGGLGSGKTFLAVRTALRYRKIQNIIYFLSFIPGIRFFTGKRHKCEVYSNIPIIIKRRRKKKGHLYSFVLRKEHILMKERLPENACVVIDELGQFASQYDHDNPYVMEYIQEFIRFFRHYINGALIVTDQCSANIVVPIRRRIATIYCVSNFRRALGLLPFYFIDVQELTITDEQVSNVNQMDIETKKEYFFGFLPYRWLSRVLKLGKYDSRCYSIMYMADKTHTAPVQWDNLKTNYIIDIYATGEQRKAYKQKGILPREIV